MRVCLGHLFASVGFYKPEASLFSYLMYYHTLMWVVCRAPGEEHIPIMHRLGFVSQAPNRASNPKPFS